MKARLVPVYYLSPEDEDFKNQLAILKYLLADDAEFLKPVELGQTLPEAEAALFPQMLGLAYRKLPAFKVMTLPLLVLTSPFGTVNMWDWEIVSYLRSEGINIFAPNTLEQSKLILKMMAVKRELKTTTFLVFQDNPGEGFQADIFKRFYWWEDQCLDVLKSKFGVNIVKKSFKTLGAEAKALPDSLAKETLAKWDVPSEGLSEKALLSAIKMYLALKKEAEADSSIKSMGINCLNESRCSDTTPCLAWDLLFQEKGIIWGCEADLMVMVTKYLMYKSLGAPIMMTNIYPFLMGKAALKHERIPNFPEIVEEPDNHLLLAHCGYFGVVPRPFATSWVLKPKVLAIVDDNAHAQDARIATGPVTLTKLDPKLEKVLAMEGNLKGYAQYPGSDSINCGIVKINDGYKFLETVYSHHMLVMNGHHNRNIDQLAKVFGMRAENI